MLVKRKIIEINEELCNGCGQCVLDCAEGAIRIENGKAKVKSDNLCDGLGACIGGCPTGALKIIEKTAAAFDHSAVAQELQRMGNMPGSALEMFPEPGMCAGSYPVKNHSGTRTNWPVKLRLQNAIPLGAHILLCADCAAVITQDLQKIIKDKHVITYCPKFEDGSSMAEKLALMLKSSKPKSLSVLRVSVPCCQGTLRLCQQAISMSGLQITLTDSIQEF